MVSSTFTDLKEHRAALIRALNEHDLHANAMESDSAKPAGDVIDSSLQMVRDSAAYIVLISLKYGQIPACPRRNPDKLSITELEFNEAQRLNRPTLLYIMSEKHAVIKADVERDPAKEAKLDAFRERAKQDPVSKVNRVYAVFESLEEFKVQLPASLHVLCNHLDQQEAPAEVKASSSDPGDCKLPAPPVFYAAPDYIGRTNFIGRQAQLQLLNAWAQASDPTSVLLFEAIGGTGKSMLTWEWTTKHATNVRGDWAGRFWYSFYEKGAVMRGFCQHALAYMTRQPLEAFANKSTAELGDQLLVALRQKPWLLILDGLERVLVAYHRLDAAELRDEELNFPTDKILDRDPCEAIRDEDTDLLRALAAATPSKILISSRLIPRVLLNPAGLPILGVTHPLKLPGLDDADAEQLLHSCGVDGTSADIRYYLNTYCGNHPLVIGVLAGLINAPGPHRGNFDGWAADPAYGAKLNLASLNLIQSRNHILHAALEDLEPASRQLLSTLALLSSAVDYETVAAFNPHLPLEPKEVKVPVKPEDDSRWECMPDEEKANRRRQYEDALAKRKAYEQAVQEWRESAAVRQAPKQLNHTVADLEHRGLLQYDRRAHRYDLHPVVRGVAAGNLNAEDMESYGQKVVDHFNSKPHNPYEQAKAIADVEAGLQVVRTLLKLGRYQQAADALKHDLVTALLVNLEANVETLALLRPFFSAGWNEMPQNLDAATASHLTNTGALALSQCGNGKQAIGAYAAALQVNLENNMWRNSSGNLFNIAQSLSGQNRLAQALRASALAHELSIASEDIESLFVSRLDLFISQSRLGHWSEAEATWQRLDPMGRQWGRNAYRRGDAEWSFARSQFWQGHLQEKQISAAATLAEQDHNRVALRYIYKLCGSWRLEQGDWALAAASFTQAVTMAREVRLVDAASETGLALAKFQLRQLTGEEALNEAQRLAQLRKPAHRSLAHLWQMLGDLDQAKHHALAAYTWAWADGEPYVNRYELTKTTELLHELGVPIPNLPPYDPANDEPFPWEAEVRAAIEKIRAEKADEVKAKQHGEVETFEFLNGDKGTEDSK
jgi:tetratricopeptide (TPR) repeat protein